MLNGMDWANWCWFSKSGSSFSFDFLFFHIHFRLFKSIWIRSGEDKRHLFNMTDKIRTMLHTNDDKQWQIGRARRSDGVARVGEWIRATYTKTHTQKWLSEEENMNRKVPPPNRKSLSSFDNCCWCCCSERWWKRETQWEWEIEWENKNKNSSYWTDNTENNVMHVDCMELIDIDKKKRILFIP